MTKTEFINLVHSSLTETSKKDTAEIVQAVFNTLADAIKADERFSYPGFGTFKVKHRKERQGMNPQTREAITIPASKTVSFKVAPSLKDEL